MKRLKLLAAVALLGIPLAACEEATPPPPVGSIVGQVSIEGTGIDGVSVNLSNGNSTTTSGGGSYRFDNVEGGAYTVTISGYPSDATFDATSAAATISSAGQSVTVNFSGSYIRTASVMGTVTVENMGLPGVTVTLTGVSGATAVTDDGGQYAFTGLRMGNYSVEISGFDSDEVGFSATAASVTVGTGESKIVSFDGTYLRTAGIMGRVSVEGEGLEGVNVSLSGGPDNVSETTTTDAAGQYSFARLRAGDYAVGISGYDTDDYEFEVTSQNVTVALGETANVPFEGLLLRTSGISGRVSVEGMGLADITVTLSGADMDDRTAMTDAGGTYAFSGLAAGDYTVAIAVESNAYVFESMSMDVTVGDDEVAIANFEGTHAATASISGMLFVDEATKNMTYDEGEDAFPAPGVPVVLVGPGVNDRVPSATNEQGQFMFPGLKAGAYQLVVPITEEIQMVLGDYAYGGPSTGYEFDIAVGEQATQAIPFHITHQTVNFSVWMKHGDMTGDALPGAMVKLYADQAGSSQVGSGTTAGDMALTSIRFARAGTTGNTVFAAIEADGYDISGAMQAVMWDPKYPTGDVVTNTADIVNLSADVTFSGATITTAAGGGYPLSEWAITVTMMDEDGEMVAVEGAPEELGEADAADDGMASFMSTAASADDLPMTYYFGIVGHEDQSNSLDRGQMFEVTPMPSDDAMADGDMLKFVHDGLSVAGKMDLGTLVLKYTTQRLFVWAHQEKDQVPGWTRTIEGGDIRPWAGGIRSGSSDPNFRRVPGITFELRHIDANGRSRPVPGYENRERHPYTRYGTADEGFATYLNVPTDLNIVVTARVEDGRKIINNDEAQGYRDRRGNKIWGSMFGEHGGFDHTVWLCPETADDPDQDYDITTEFDWCSTFAYVWTRDVNGEAFSQSVEMAENPLDGHDMETTYHSGIELALNPVARKNVQADNFGATSRAENTRTLARELGTYTIANIGDGDYTRSTSSGWTTAGRYFEFTTSEYGADVLPRPDVTIDMFPSSNYLYGTVVDEDGIGVEDVEVTSGGQTVVTDDYGRYILQDVPHNSRAWTYVDVAKAGYQVTNRTAHAIANNYIARIFLAAHVTANNPQEMNFSVKRVNPTGTVSGTIKHLQSDAPLEGVRVFALELDEAAPADLSLPGLLQVDRDAADNPVYTFDGVPFEDVDTTDAAGAFSVKAPAGALDGKTTTIVAYRSGMFFMPDRHITTVVDGGEYTLSFDGLKLSAIDGYIVDGNGDGMAGVTVTAVGGTTGSAGVTRVATTLASGRYNIRVPWGPYTVTPTKDAYSFEPENLTVTLAAEQIQTLQNFEASMDANVAPVISSAAAFSVVEGETAAGTVVAADADAEDDVTGYAITGGADMARLSIDAMGALTFNDPPDYEDPTDADKDRVYEVTVTATSGTGARARTSAPQDITVTVTNDPADDPVDATPAVTLLLDGAAADKTIEEGDMVAVTATVTPAVDAPFSVTVALGGAGAATAEFADGQAMLYFAANATSSSGDHLGNAVEIHAVNDNAYTGERDVTVTGSTTATGVTVPNPTAGPLTITIEDDDVPPPMVSLHLSATSISENAGTSTLTARLDKAHSLDVVVAVANPANLGAHTFSANSLTIPAGSLTSTLDANGSPNANQPSITITGTDNDLDAADLVLTIAGVADDDADPLTAPGVMGPAAVTLTITDDDAVPSAPRNLTLTAGNAQITAEWISSLSAGTSAITGYQYRAYTGAAPAAGWNNATSPQTINTDAAGTALVNGTTYTVEVRAQSAAGDGPVASATATPAAP